MNLFRAWISAAALSVAATGASAATIDRMTTGAWETFNRPYQPTGTIVIFGRAQAYELTDGSTWWAGAGWAPYTYATVSDVSVNATELSFVLTNIRQQGTMDPSNLLFTHIDFNSGDHSAMGELAAPESLTITATQGSAIGVMRGYSKILSNPLTWYGEPRFNYYSASVGSEVYFEQQFQLLNATFQPELFVSGAPEIEYTVQGFVDFKKVAPVPEPGSTLLIGVGLGALAIRVTHRRRSASS
ncbi:MAG: PEP-CTERM sorting domain-containing protein [Rubrivivax sp.]|nr:MAG: PEP-CTERM sorting domain-containing protein [Rubrivivax sp.]